MKDIQRVKQYIKVSLALSVDKCSHLISKFLRKGTKIAFDNISYSTVPAITDRLLAHGDREVVASFLDFRGTASFKFLFYVDYRDSLTLSDLILRREIGTTKETEIYGRSAVQEISNILGSVYTNVFSKDFDVALHLSTPRMVRGKLSLVFQEYVRGIHSSHDDILWMENVLNVVGHNINCYTLIVPVAQSETLLEGLVVAAT